MGMTPDESRRVSNIENMMWFGILSWALYDAMLKLLKNIPQQHTWWTLTIVILTLFVAFLSGLFFALALFFFMRISKMVSWAWVSYIKNKVIPSFIKPTFKFIKGYKLYFSRSISFFLLAILGIVFYEPTLDYWTKLIMFIGVLMGVDLKLKKYS